MLKRYIVVELEVIEKNRQKLFYCEKEDFATNLISACPFGHVYFKIDISFGGVVFVRYTLGEVGTHGDTMLFTQLWDNFLCKTRDNEQLRYLNVRNFAVGDVLKIATTFKSERFQRSFSDTIKYSYLGDGYETRPVLYGKELSEKELDDCYDNNLFRDLNWRYIVLGQNIIGNELSNARKKSRTGQPTGISVVDNAKEIIFRRYRREKII